MSARRLCASDSRPPVWVLLFLRSPPCWPPHAAFWQSTWVCTHRHTCRAHADTEWAAATQGPRLSPRGCVLGSPAWSGRSGDPGRALLPALELEDLGSPGPGLEEAPGAGCLGLWPWVTSQWSSPTAAILVTPDLASPGGGPSGGCGGLVVPAGACSPHPGCGFVTGLHCRCSRRCEGRQAHRRAPGPISGCGPTSQARPGARPLGPSSWSRSPGSMSWPHRTAPG